MKKFFRRFVTNDFTAFKKGESKADFLSVDRPVSLRGKINPVNKSFVDPSPEVMTKRSEKRKRGKQKESCSHRLSEVHFFQNKFMQ